MSRRRFRTRCAASGVTSEDSASRDWLWLKDWRIGREHGMGGPVDVENEGQCKTWMNEARTHATTFLNPHEADSFIAECDEKLRRRRAELAAGRARNAETDASVARLRADLATEKARRAKENRERLAASDRQRADFRAELDRGMAEAKVEASLAFDRRVARKEVARHAWLSEYWTKIARARDDKEFRDEWLAKVSAENPERAADLRKVFRSAGDSASALRGAEQFDLIRQRWVRVVELLDADPTLTSDEAEDIADPEYREQRAEVTDSQMENMITDAAVRSQDERILAEMRTWSQQEGQAEAAGAIGGARIRSHQTTAKALAAEIAHPATKELSYFQFAPARTLAECLPPDAQPPRRSGARRARVDGRASATVSSGLAARAEEKGGASWK